MFFFFFWQSAKRMMWGKEQDGHRPDYIRLLHAARWLLLDFRLQKASLVSTTCKKLWEANVDKVSSMSRSSQFGRDNMCSRWDQYSGIRGPYVDSKVLDCCLQLCWECLMFFLGGSHGETWDSPQSPAWCPKQVSGLLLLQLPLSKFSLLVPKTVFVE